MTGLPNYFYFGFDKETLNEEKTPTWCLNFHVALSFATLKLKVINFLCFSRQDKLGVIDGYDCTLSTKKLIAASKV